MSPVRSGDQMGDIIIRHEVGSVTGDRTVDALDDTCTLVKRSQFTVKNNPDIPFSAGISPLEEDTSRIASAKEVISVRITRMCLFCSNARYSATVRHFWSDQTFYDRIICQV